MIWVDFIARLKHWLDIENNYSDYDKDGYSYLKPRLTMFHRICIGMAIVVVLALVVGLV